MSPSDLFLLLIRWLHALAAVAWVGGSIFFLLVLRPALQGQSGGEALSRAVAQEFRVVVDTAIGILLVTGIIMAVQRLTSGDAGVAYGVVLGIKIALSLWMVYLVRFRERRPPRPAPFAGGPAPLILLARARARGLLGANNLILALGVVVILLSEMLRYLFEGRI